jgi:DNA-binding transcriptional ArsR family regulator
MPDAFPFTDIAALVEEPSRAAILGVLLRGGSYTATELAERTGSALSTTRSHLTRMRDQGLVSRASQGRYRFFRLASPEVARALEGLSELKPHSRAAPRTAADVPRDIRFARSCYGHLAGWLGVSVTQVFLDRALMLSTNGGLEVTSAGLSWLSDHAVAIPEAGRSGRKFVRSCLDWTEKRPHLSGMVGTAILTRFLEIGWLEHWSGDRTLKLTPTGESGLSSSLGLALH